MWEKIVQNFEPIGLALLLAAFGWQCWEDHANQIKMEGYVYELNEKMLAVWEGVYDEALHSNRYNGKAIVSVNYDSLNAQMKDWKQMTDVFSTLDKQIAFFFWYRFILFAVGSLLIIISKWPRHKIFASKKR